MQNECFSPGLHLALDRAAALISRDHENGAVPAGSVLVAAHPDASNDDGGVEACEMLLESGFFALRQLEVLLAFVPSRTEALQIIPTVIDRATAYGSATPAAVGAAASLVDVVRSDDVLDVVDSITSARSLLGDADLARGVAAVIASLSEQIAASVHVDATVVHGELRRELPRALVVGRSDAGSPMRACTRVRRGFTRVTDRSRRFPA